MLLCGNIKCKYHNDKNKCTCKKVSLTFCGVNTKNEGLQEFLKCNSFEEDEEYKRLKSIIENALKKV